MQDANINTAIDNRRVYNLVAYFFFLNVSFILFSNANILLTEFRINNKQFWIVSITCQTSNLFACMIFLKGYVPNFHHPKKRL